MELKGENLINIAFNHWLKKYGFDARVRGVDTDFFWYHDDTISYSFFFSEKSAENWELLLDELGCEYKVDMFYSAFLHELGHSNTYFSFDDDEIEECETIHSLICEDPNTFSETPEYIYTHLSVEYEATRWAVEYINQYPERIAELVNLVGKAVRNFYRINEVVTEDMFLN